MDLFNKKRVAALSAEVDAKTQTIDRLQSDIRLYLRQIGLLAKQIYRPYIGKYVVWNVDNKTYKVVNITGYGTKLYIELTNEAGGERNIFVEPEKFDLTFTLAKMKKATKKEKKA